MPGDRPERLRKALDSGAHAVIADLEDAVAPEDKPGARQALASAWATVGLVAPVDGVTAALDDEPRLAADAARSRRLGFGGKLCIHPRQVGPVNEGLGPTPAQRAGAAARASCWTTDAFCQGDGALRPLPRPPSRP